MKALCILLGVVAHLGTFVSVWWLAGWWPLAICLALNVTAGLFYAISERLR